MLLRLKLFMAEVNELFYLMDSLREQHFLLLQDLI